jgi:signal transduction histidine kinase
VPHLVSLYVYDVYLVSLYVYFYRAIVYKDERKSTRSSRRYARWLKWRKGRWPDTGFGVRKALRKDWATTLMNDIGEALVALVALVKAIVKPAKPGRLSARAVTLWLRGALRRAAREEAREELRARRASRRAGPPPAAP